MTSMIDPTSSKPVAFARGFWKGMAAPLLIFSNFDLPSEARPMEFRPLERSGADDISDWVRVGDELRAAIAKYRAERG